MKKLAFALLALAASAATAAPNLSNPILFVTQVPTPADFTTIASTFGNQDGQPESAPRGGDLWIRYPDGTLKNLTRTAGYGMPGFQGAQSIAVRDPSVHWSGTKALFSMVIGSPTQQYVRGEFYWQIYEITGLGQSETPVIKKIANQPPDYNNISPIYATDDRILFTSDRPRNGARHLYPQLDEYEEAPVVTGIWSLDPASGNLRLLNHTPSGAFTPLIDSYGRLLFTRWDHLQRDQQADADAESETYGTFDYADESASAAKLNQRVEVFPEPRGSRTDLLAGTNLQGNSINHFFPWEMNEDGTSEETLNHVGRHELQTYFDRVFNDDPALEEFISAGTNRTNQNEVESLFQIKEDPTHAGRYYAIDAPEFSTHGAGQLVWINGEPTRPADQMTVTYVTPRSTRDFDGTPAADNSGHYRDPLPLANGTLLAVHAGETRADANEGSREQPKSRYAFRIKTLTPQNSVYVPGEAITSGLTATVSYWDPDVMVNYSGELWELSPVEVRARTRPVPRTTPLEQPEARIFAEEGVDVQAFKRDLAAKELALIVSRDVTARDVADKQQPYNLTVAGGTAKHITGNGKSYEIAHMQLFQADQIRGVGGIQDPKDGRRVLARAMHDPAVKNPPTTGPTASVKIGADGSMAAIVPAHRAMSWQLTDTAGTPVVRERYWITFQPGEVRVCAACHGINSRDQLNKPTPQNSPEALRALLKFWKSQQPPAQGRRRSAKK